MRILVAAATVMLAGMVTPAWALDDTPTQTPYLSSRTDEARPVNRREPEERRVVRSPPPAAPAPAAPAAAAAATPAAAPAQVSIPPVPSATPLASAGRVPVLPERSIGLR